MIRYLFLAITFIAVPLAVSAQSTLGKESLKGLNGIYVLVERYDKDVEKNGLHESQIVTDAQMRLRKAGIRVLSETESFDQDAGTLVIMVNTREYNGLYAYCVDFYLQQSVRTPRAPKEAIVGSTYLVAPTVGTVGVNNLRAIQDIINEKVDALINDYLSVNPKP